MSAHSRVRQAGTFTISPGRNISGELTLAGDRTSLYLYDSEPFNTHGVRHLNGVLADLTKISLVKCITTSGPGSGSRGEDRYHFANIFSHFVTYGDCHVTPDVETVTAVHFVIDDAPTLFYDFDAFSTVIDARPFIDEIAHANKLDREIKTGPEPQIVYFTGKREIFSTDTVLGKISAQHNPTYPFGGPKGVCLRNTISVTIRFKRNVVFEDAITRVLVLVRYFGLLIGRPQNVPNLSLSLGASDQRLRVYWSMPPKRDSSSHGDKPQPAEVLVEPVRQSEAFNTVLRNWLERNEAWQDARLRFFNSFAEQRRYDIDRLIGAANMFDILPTSAAPRDLELPEQLTQAQVAARALFLGLPPSPERDSVLGALGRMGKSKLKQKIRYRAERIIDACGDHFPDILSVVDEAVNCRNHYVHGAEARIDYSQNFDVVTFFIDTLDFVFAASDLIECGWDIKAWSQTYTSTSHPFDRFRINYRSGLQMFRALVPDRA
jgi:hypothetical protein